MTVKIYTEIQYNDGEFQNFPLIDNEWANRPDYIPFFIMVLLDPVSKKFSRSIPKAPFDFYVYGKDRTKQYIHFTAFDNGNGMSVGYQIYNQSMRYIVSRGAMGAFDYGAVITLVNDGSGVNLKTLYMRDAATPKITSIPSITNYGVFSTESIGKIAVSTYSTKFEPVSGSEWIYHPDKPAGIPHGTLFYNKSEKNAIMKDLKTILECNMTFNSPVDILSPTIDIKSDDIENIVARANYMYIDKLSRYYFITGMEIIRTGLLRITGKVDVLMTYASQIKQQKAIIARNTAEYNLLLNDPNFEFQANPIIKTKRFPNYKNFLNDNFEMEPHYVLVISGR